MSSSFTPLTNTRHLWVWSSGASAGRWFGSNGWASLPKTALVGVELVRWALCFLFGEISFHFGGLVL